MAAADVGRLSVAVTGGSSPDRECYLLLLVLRVAPTQSGGLRRTLGGIVPNVLSIPLEDPHMVSSAPPSRPPVGDENLRKGPHRVDVEPTPRRVRVVFNGQTIADSKRAIL